MKIDNYIHDTRQALWYPGKVCHLTDVPSNIKCKFQSLSNRFIVYWYGDDEMYILVREVEKLGEHTS